MIKSLFVLGTAAGMMLAAAAAGAGTCSTEIEGLQKKLSSSDAGMGPTGTGNVAGNAGAMGTITETGQLHPPTDAMNQATEGKAASSNDVLNQNQGAPTSSDAAAAGQSGSAGGAPQASDALQRARQFDQAGNETACMNEIGKAKAQLGAQ
jgi:hypothetical protein